MLSTSVIDLYCSTPPKRRKLAKMVVLQGKAHGKTQEHIEVSGIPRVHITTETKPAGSTVTDATNDIDKLVY